MKTLLASLLGTKADEKVLEASYRLAALFNGHIDALHVRPDPAQVIAASSAALEPGMSLTAILGEVWDSILEANKSIAGHAHRNFQKFADDRGLPMRKEPGAPDEISASWLEVEGAYARAVTSTGRLHDAVVLAGSANEGELLPELGSILTGCGRPLLLVPRHVADDISSSIAIAWKETPEAARAVTAAMPLLRLARRVVVLTVSEDEADSEASGQKLVEQLRWHGLKVVAHRVPVDNLSPAETLTVTTKDVGAKMLVMGGYGHSRAFEFIFGGFTRHALADAPLPVLMAH